MKYNRFNFTRTYMLRTFDVRIGVYTTKRVILVERLGHTQGQEAVKRWVNFSWKIRIDLPDCLTFALPSRIRHRVTYSLRHSLETAIKSTCTFVTPATARNSFWNKLYSLNIQKQSIIHNAEAQNVGQCCKHSVTTKETTVVPNFPSAYVVSSKLHSYIFLLFVFLHIYTITSVLFTIFNEWNRLVVLTLLKLL